MKLSTRPALPIAGLAVIMAALSSTAAAQTALSEEISASKGYELIESTDAILVDVRTPMEWRQTGIPAGAQTITLQDEDFIDQVEGLADGDKEAPVAFIFRSGTRSAKTRDRLQAEGFTNVTSVAGGMSGKAGWIAEDLPVQPWP